MTSKKTAGRGGIRRIGVSTGGGDAPGLNAVIRSVALCAHSLGWEAVGIRDGYNGIFLRDEYPDDGGLIPLAGRFLAAFVQSYTYLAIGCLLGFAVFKKAPELGLD